MGRPITVRRTGSVGGLSGISANRTYEKIRQEVDRILAEADETDAEEDARFGQARGDEVPQELTDPVTRRERLECAKRELEAEQAARVAEHEAMLARRAEHRERTGRNPRGRPPGDGPGPEPPADAKRNITDPDSRIMRDRGAHVQAYNAQAVVGEGRVILAADVTTSPNDSHQLLAMLRATRENLLPRAGNLPPPRARVFAAHPNTPNRCVRPTLTQQPHGNTNRPRFARAPPAAGTKVL